MILKKNESTGCSGRGGVASRGMDKNFKQRGRKEKMENLGQDKNCRSNFWKDFHRLGIGRQLNPYPHPQALSFQKLLTNQQIGVSITQEKNVGWEHLKPQTWCFGALGAMSICSWVCIALALLHRFTAQRVKEPAQDQHREVKSASSCEAIPTVNWCLFPSNSTWSVVTAFTWAFLCILMLNPQGLWMWNYEISARFLHLHTYAWLCILIQSLGFQLTEFTNQSGLMFLKYAGSFRMRCFIFNRETKISANSLLTLGN